MRTQSCSIEPIRGPGCGQSEGERRPPWLIIERIERQNSLNCDVPGRHLEIWMMLCQWSPSQQRLSPPRFVFLHDCFPCSVRERTNSFHVRQADIATGLKNTERMIDK